jgi:hypothetical protein
VHGTRATQSHAASEFCSGESQGVAQNPEQRRFRRYIDLVLFGIHQQIHAGHVSTPRSIKHWTTIGEKVGA